jgi:hypothetical protein
MALKVPTYREAKRELQRLTQSLKNMVVGRKKGEAKSPHWLSAKDKLEAREEQLPRSARSEKEG